MNWHHWYWWTWPVAIAIGLGINYLISRFLPPRTLSFFPAMRQLWKSWRCRGGAGDARSS